MRQRYRKKKDQYVTAVQFNLDIDGFSYTKWGGAQHCKRGDWLVDNSGEAYTVDRDTFAKTYKKLSPGVYLKTAPVWAQIAGKPGAVKTKEGMSHYNPGDYIVSNSEDGADAYCIAADKFTAMYERDE